jgi:ATP-dependent Lon protease
MTNHNDGDDQIIDIPEIEVVDDDSRTGSPGESTAILKSDSLPQEIALVTGHNKPVFPGMIFPVVLSNQKITGMFSELAEEGKVIGFVVSRKETEATDPETVRDNLYSIGTAARVVNFEQHEDGTVNALMKAIDRFEILRIRLDGEKMYAQVMYIHETPVEGEHIKALALAIMNAMRDLMQNNPMFSEEIKMFLSQGTWDDPGQVADFSVTMTSAQPHELQDILETIDIEERLKKGLFLLRKEVDLNELKEKITHQIEERITQQQREFFLHEQLTAIKQELGLEKDDRQEEIDRYELRLKKLKLSEEAEDRVGEELEKLALMPPQSPEYIVVRNYLDWITQLPWGILTKDRLNVAKARRILNRDHYGLEDVKARILEFIGVSKLRGSVGGSILCLVGPPGVGKTSLGRAVAQSLGREFFRFSLGGMRDEAEIKGHRRTYIGAMPGKIIQTIKTTSSQNPVIMLDEIDKINASFHGDPASALLEVLDPEQNCTFHDHYLDLAFDLSKVLFIATANVPDTIPGPLLDRMEVIRLSGYIMQEKLQIAKRHLIPKQIEAHGLTKQDIAFPVAGIRHLIDGYAREAGVRGLEKCLRTCMRKVAAQKAEHPKAERVTVTKKIVEEYLGRPAFADDMLANQNTPGVVTGLAWTAFGGTVLFIEAMAIPGTPGFQRTGQLGDVMIESGSIAYSVVNSNAKAYKVDKDFFKSHTIHLHVPAGATPKDGPSAGITMAAALISMATQQALPPDLAMTGELTLTGAVLPVGGIREKIVAAKRSAIRDVILPHANEPDFDEIPDTVRDGIQPHFVKDFKAVYRLLFRDGIAKSRKAAKG